MPEPQSEPQHFTAGLVLGASSGIGAAVARRLTRYTDVVHAASRSGRMPEGASPGAVRAWRADAADYGAVDRLLRDAAPLDWLVMCVGAGRYAPLSGDFGAAWLAVLEANVLTVANLLAAVSARQPNLGTLVVLLSLAAHQPSTTPGNAMYSAAKTGAATLLDQYRAELRLRGSTQRVCAVSPGYVRGTAFAEQFFQYAPEHATDLYDGRASMTPDAVASAIEFAVLAPREVEVSQMIIRPLPAGQPVNPRPAGAE